MAEALATEGLAEALTDVLATEAFLVDLRAGVLTGLGFRTSLVADFLFVEANLALGVRLGGGDGDLAGVLLRAELFAGEGLAGELLAGVALGGLLAGDFGGLLMGEGLRDDFLGVGDALRGEDR